MGNGSSETSQEAKAVELSNKSFAAVAGKLSRIAGDATTFLRVPPNKPNWERKLVD